MKINLGLLIVMILIPVSHTSKGNYVDPQPFIQREQTLRYNFNYTCWRASSGESLSEG